ncbi:DNA methyltransferase [Arthrobacter phage DrYang]|uniref:DNA methylase n=1 Tax=Arthrobacter phage DrYang TaxID=2686080 RepID=A0A6B9JKQ3_9CAUD|nr:DNA methyltransferase [Arthrobacter phage DrYang]QGZ17177.1 hypothetical protein SEA_DRYANG_78 [Arthrobacter phage DrYang]
MGASAFSDSESDATSSTLLKTPTSQLAVNGGSQHPDKRKAGGHGPTLADEIEHALPAVEEVPESSLLLTPVAAEGVKPSNTMGVNRRLSTGQLFLTNQVVTIMGLDPSEQDKILPTPRASDGLAGPDPLERPERMDDIATRVKRITLFPTPTTQETKSGPSQANRNTPPLNHVVTDLLPTPIASDGKGTGPADAKRETVQLRAITELLPTPKGSDGEKGGPNQRGSKGDYALPAVGHLLPTPAANDSGNTPEEHLRKKPGRTQVTSLQVIADHGLIETGGKVLPTPVGSEISAGGEREGQLSGEANTVNWGAYAPAIARWERVCGILAPTPTIPTGRDGAQRLNPAFVEWMMGLEPGHVTGVDIPRSAMLKALGNGVCPQQATVAINHLLGMFVRAYGLTA